MLLVVNFDTEAMNIAVAEQIIELPIYFKYGSQTQRLL